MESFGVFENDILGCKVLWMVSTLHKKLLVLRKSTSFDGFFTKCHTFCKIHENRTLKTNVRSYKFLMPSAKLSSMTYSALKALHMRQQKRTTGKKSRNSIRSGTDWSEKTQGMSKMPSHSLNSSD